MADNLEKKSEEKPKTLNDLFKKYAYESLNSMNLHDYFLKITPKIMVYPENSQISFTP